MNQQERDEMRAKHRMMTGTYRNNQGEVVTFSLGICVECSLVDDSGESYNCPLTHEKEVDHPCDTIKVLDAWEATPARVLQPERTNGSVNLAAMDTVDTDTVHGDTPKYPPEGQNAWQNSIKNDTEVTETCAHIRHNLCLCDFSDDGCSLDDEPDYPYCPKCGEKL